MNFEIPCIPEFFSGKDVFVTGATGFLGKVLVEKLLRSCPDLRTTYILLRPKKGKEPKDRIKDIIDVPVSKFLFLPQLIAPMWRFNGLTQ